MEKNKRAKAEMPINLRLLIILEAIAKAGVPVTPSEINRDLKLPRPTIHRLFATLESEGFVQRDIDGRGYTLGRRTRKLATEVMSSRRIRLARAAILARLSQKIGETCNITIPDRDGMIYVDRVETKWELRVQLPIGSTVPFHCTASGKLYLSTLNDQHLLGFLKATPLKARTPATLTEPAQLITAAREIRERGYATDNEEFISGMIAVAVPVLNPSGQLMSTLACHAPTQRLSLAGALRHVETLKATAQTLSTLIANDGD